MECTVLVCQIKCHLRSLELRRLIFRFLLPLLMQRMDRDGLFLITQNINISIQAWLRRLLHVKLLHLLVSIWACDWLLLIVFALVYDINVWVGLRRVIVVAFGSSIIHDLSSSLLDHLIPSIFDVFWFVFLWGLLLHLSLMAH